MHFSIDRTVHTTAFDKPVVDHWLERKIAQTAAGSTEKDRSDDRPLQRRARYRLSYIPLRVSIMTDKSMLEEDKNYFIRRPKIRRRERTTSELGILIVYLYCLLPLVPTKLFLDPDSDPRWCNKGCGMCYPVCGMVHIK